MGVRHDFILLAIAVSLGEKLGGDDLALRLGGVSQVVDIFGQHQRRSSQPVTIFDDKQRRVLAMFFHPTLRLGLDRATRRLGQFPRPQTFFGRSPDRVPFQAGHGCHARLAAHPPLDHALQHLQCVEAIDVEPGKTDRDGLVDRRLQIVFEPRITPHDRCR